MKDSVEGIGFSLRSHLCIVHSIIDHVVNEGDCVIDATLGRGRDALALARKLFSGSACSHSTLVGFDLQEEAVTSSQQLLIQEGYGQYIKKSIFLYQSCHSALAETMHREFPGRGAKLVVYNLGYLPQGDKSLITQPDTTRCSLSDSFALIENGGSVLVTVYPGHEGGELESKAVLECVGHLDPNLWQVWRYHPLNQPTRPYVLWIHQRLGRRP